MLPMLRQTNSSPGSVWVIISGTTRLSAQVMNRMRGFCALASCSNCSRRSGKTWSRNSRTPSNKRSTAWSETAGETASGSDMRSSGRHRTMGRASRHGQLEGASPITESRIRAAAPHGNAGSLALF